jgi:hypothetical protein
MIMCSVSLSSVIKKSSAEFQTAEDKNFFSWYHLSFPLSRPHGGLSAPQAVSGFPVFAYLPGGFSKATPKGIPHLGSHCLAATGSSLGERVKCVLGFINVLAIFTFLTV